MPPTLENGRHPRAPALFVSHGAGPFPAFAADHASYRAMLRRHGAPLLGGCRAVLLATAHWETPAADGPRLSAADAPGIYYDYEHMRPHLPPQCFQITYEGRGDAALAARVVERLRAAGWAAGLERRGWDHGVFVPMASLLPEGEVPIVQMSVMGGGSEVENTARNVALGEVLEGLRDEGVAVVGSGGSSHDFMRIAKSYSGEEEIPPEIKGELLRFEDWLRDVAEVGDVEERKKMLSGWREAPANKLAHPVGQSEHLMPFMIAAGAGGNDKGRRLDQWDLKGTPVGLYVWEAA
ncbi:Extradiol ring-cleavage dioxygenase, class III enzyme, subunit B [Neofusicoccum parvum]|nr:Extradiol ring-cleavage dioxygenase, class III enzyme, subunit B [Neofusicoccum parvum]